MGILTGLKFNAALNLLIWEKTAKGDIKTKRLKAGWDETDQAVVLAG